MNEDEEAQELEIDSAMSMSVNEQQRKVLEG
jgi:hypothetical protein